MPGRKPRSQERDDTDFGKLLTEHLDRKGITQAELAEESNVSEETISRMKKGERATTPAARINLRSLIRALHELECLDTLEEANALMTAIPTMAALDERDKYDAELIKLLTRHHNQESTEEPEPTESSHNDNNTKPFAPTEASDELPNGDIHITRTPALSSESLRQRSATYYGLIILGGLEILIIVAFVIGSITLPILPQRQHTLPHSTPAQTLPSQLTVYISTWFGHSTYALRASDGARLWFSQNGGSHADEALTLADGVIYCGSDDHFIYALRAKDGSLLWKHQTGGINSPPTVNSGTVYDGSWDGTLYALDAKTGAVQWQFQTGGQIHSSPVVVNNVVYFGSGDGNVYAIRTDGSFLWSYHTGGMVYAPAAVVSGAVYIGSGDYTVYALRASDGTRLWSYRAEAQDYSGATVNNGTVYIDSGKHLYELRADNGSLIQRILVGQKGGAQPAVVDGVIYVCSVDSNVYAIRASDGSLLWQYTTEGFLGAKPVILDNTIYIGGSSGLYTLTLDGKLKWKFIDVGVTAAALGSSQT